MGGATSVLLPSFSFKYTDFRFTIQTTLVDIGITYYLYMAMLAIFCTHSINILAGVNGVEVGQSLIIAGSLAVHNCLSICSQSKFWAFSKVYDDQMCLKILMNNQLSLTILLPFIGVSLALLKNNWYPASIFVGDTFCYFSGMTLAVAGILGHSGRILLVLLIPQIVNFLLSLPQLFGIIVCPRHRLPTLDPSTGLLKPSIFEIHLQPGSPGFLLVQKLLIPTNLAALNCTNNTLIENQSEKKNQTLTLKNDKHDCVNKDINVTVVNLTLLNVILKYFGPMHEARLTLFIIGFQLLSSLIVLSITHLHPTKIVTNIMRTLAENLNV